MMSVLTSKKALTRGLRVQSGLGLLMAAFLLPVCLAQLSDQNAPVVPHQISKKVVVPPGSVNDGASAPAPVQQMVEQPERAAEAVVHPDATNAATTVSVDAGANQHPINPNIYGVAWAGTSELAALNAPINRYGGNNTSDYNWQQDAWNLDNDWYFESYLLNGPPVVEGANADNFIQTTRAANLGAQPMITVPMLPYIAKVAANANSGAASLWSFSIAKYGAQTGADPYQSDAGNGVSSATGKDIVNDPSDAYVPNSAAIQGAWINHLVGKWGNSTTSTGVKYYQLDNEPSIWSGTHRDAHPAEETYDELWADIQAYAGAIKAADPNAIVLGPEEWCWWAMWLSGYDQANGSGAGSDYATHNNTYYYPWLLQQLAAYKKANGKPLIDILSVHCYSDTNPNYNQATRMLWDPTFTDAAGWFADGGQNGGIVDYIPTMQNWVKAAFPNGDGPQIGCTEYGGWGEDDTTLAGATVEADVLGIFGYYGFDLASDFSISDTPTQLAFEIYRNYDGNLSTFGDTSVSTTVANPDNLSSFAALRTSDGALTVMVINKQTGSTPVTINLANFVPTSTATAYQINSATQTSIANLGSVAVASNAISTTVPAQSVTLFVIPAGTATTAPPAPTNLVANVGNNTVTLTWLGGGGATKFTIQRGPASTGPFTTIGTVTAPAAESLTDTSVTNGTTYYYQVSGTNSIGTGPYSTPIAAMPIVPPTFTSSATASPNPATQNSSTTITATVKCTANTLTNGTVEIIALDPTGATALTQTFPAQNFTANQSQTYTASLTPALTGTYTVQVEVLSASGQQWSANTSAGTITVNSALSFTSTATPNPTSINSSGSSTISFSVTNTGSVAFTNGIVQLNIQNSSGVSCGYDDITGVSITAGASQSFTYTWTPSAQSPAVTTSGTYSVDVGVFNSTWATDYYWNTDATITLTGGTSPPAFTSSATPSPASISASGSSTIAYSVTDTGGALSSANVELQVFNAAGTAVGTQVSSSQNFTAGGTLSFTYTWTPASQSPAVTAAGAYTVEIGVFNSAWSTDYYWNSNAGTITLTAGTSAPAAPTGLTATAGNASVKLSWTASTGATSYNVYRGTTVGGESTTALATGITTTSYTDATVSNGTTYYYKVAAVNSGGTSPLSTEVSATPEPSAPAAPTGLTATAANASVKLSWTGSTGATSYSVYRGTTAGGESTTALATGITTTSYTDATVSNGTTYYYKVAAVNTGGTSALSAEVSATPEPSAPAAPTGLTATAANASVKLSWTGSTGANSYNVYRGTTAGGEATAALATGITTTSYTDATVSNGTTYYYKVAAVNAGGTSPLSTEASATPEPSAPAAPTGLTATAANASVKLSWTASTGATSYSVYRGTTAGGESTTALATGITTTSYTDATVSNGTAYYYKVAAVNSGGTSPLSTEVSATPEPAAPTAPTGLTATAGNASVKLSWTASTGATSYNVYRGTTAGGEATAALATGITTTSYTDATVGNGTTYYYKVAAVNSGGTSPLSAEVSATPEPAAPTAPTGLTATAANASVKLSWTASTGATSYNVYRGTTAGGEATAALATGITITSYTDTSVSNGTAYYYKLAAVNSGGTSPLSTEVSATPEPSAPTAPTGLTATAGNASVKLSWTASTGATSYNVYRGTTTNGEATAALATGITIASYTDTTVSNGTTYYYKVAAVNSGGTSGLSTEASATPLGNVPPVPVELTATAGNAEVMLHWSASSGATSYNLYRGTMPGGEGATPIAAGVRTTNYVNTGLANGTTYFYKVAAVNAEGISALSAEASAKPSIRHRARWPFVSSTEPALPPD